jgi:hypothetical protein
MNDKNKEDGKSLGELVDEVMTGPPVTWVFDYNQNR